MSDSVSSDTNAKKQVTKRCRACTDFKTWVKMQPQTPIVTKAVSNKSKPSAPEAGEVGSPSQCPADIVTLGRSSWTLLHSMAGYYPDAPTAQQQAQMTQFFKLFTNFYPCEMCAEHFKRRMTENAPETQSRHSLSQWLCRMHNEVNERTGKPEFDCRKVDQRWRDGWADGSCD